MSGFAVTICFSGGRNLFCLNSTSPIKRYSHTWVTKQGALYFFWKKKVRENAYQLLLTNLNSHSLVPYGWNLLPSLFFLSQLRAQVCGPLKDCMPIIDETEHKPRPSRISFLSTNERAGLVYLSGPWNNTPWITSICHNKLVISY
jgi:hypothetical protein